MTDDVLDAQPEIEEPALAVDLPQDPAEAVEVLVKALHEARESEATHLDDLQRVAAEFENFRKRSLRDQQEMTARATQRIIAALLPVLDSFDGAFGHEAQSPSEEQLLSGVQSTFHQLMELLAREGLAVIPTEGESFDPTVHEAVAGGAGENLVVAGEMRRGYTLGGRVIRPALVAVSAPEETKETTEE
ncbi:MAG: nucleotide exchange factor GrpE [Acidimicrobiia bacterium]